MKFRTLPIIFICTLLLLGLAIGSSAGWNTQPASAAPAAEFIVTSAASAPDVLVGDGICATAQGNCTLIAAIQEANENVGPDTITFAEAITLIYIYLDLPLPVITDDGTTIDGEDHVHLACKSNGMAALHIGSDWNHIRGLEIQCGIGILINTGYNNVIGVEGDTPYNEGGNYIHDCDTGVMLSSSSNNFVSGNEFYDNQVAAITIDSYSAGNIIGVVDTAMFRDYLPNFVDNNPEIGILVQGNGNLVAGNIINGGEAGISVSGESNRIGTDGDGINDEEEINWIHHGYFFGVEFTSDAENNILAGNYIGTGYGGLGDDGGITGVLMGGVSNVAGPNNDGISEEVERNIISGNYTGMSLPCWGCTIRGNYFGVDVTGSGAVGNNYYALLIPGGNNTIGGDEPWQANLIAHNKGNGVHVASGATGNQILGNAIYANENLGIDLAPLSVNPNDTGDEDGGANRGQNYPALSMVTTDGASVHILGGLNSQPEKNYRLEFYANEACHASGYGEGQTYLDRLQVATDSNGDAAIDVTLPFSLPVGTAVTALATDLVTGDTSEFSACALVTYEPLAGGLYVNSTADKVDADPSDAVCDTGDEVGGVPECTLRAAIQQANASPGEDYISLPAGVYTLSIAGATENEAATGDLDITDDLTLTGAGANLSFVDGGGIDRVFDVGPGGNTDIYVYMSSITIQHGGGEPMVITGQGIANRATLVMTGTVIRYNGGTNGSIYNFATGYLILDQSTVHDNTTAGDGAGVYTQNYVTIRNSTISGNVSNDDGGGIYAESGMVYIYNSTITDNTADADDDNSGQGGGVYNNGAVVSIVNSLIVNNLDLGDAGSRNGTEAFDCYGAFVSGGYNTVTDIANDNDGVNDPLCTGFDAEGDTASGFWALGQYLVYYVPLEPLALNGGATPSHMPLLDEDIFVIDMGSPAEPGSEGACETSDQRGIPRPTDGDGDGTVRCDRGAIEASLALLSISDASVVEGGQAVFIVELYPASPITVTAYYTTAGSTALAGSDFTSLTGTLTFAPGVVTQTIVIDTWQDATDEYDEVFWIGLSEPAAAAIGKDQATGEIIDDDAEPALSIAGASVSEGDSGTHPAVFVVTLSAASGKLVQVWYADSSVSAVPNEDYLPASGLLIFEPGEVAKTITVPILGDILVEVDEIFILSLYSGVNAGIENPTAACTIRNDDNAGTGYQLYLPLLQKNELPLATREVHTCVQYAACFPGVDAEFSGGKPVR